MSDTTTTTSVNGLNNRLTAIMAAAAVTTVPAAAEVLGVEVKELYRALKAERDNADYDGPVMDAVAAYEEANPSVTPEGSEEEEQAPAPAAKPKKQAREPKAKKEKTPKAPKEEKPATLPTEVGKMQFSTGGRMQIADYNGEQPGMRSVYGVRLQEDGSYRGHIVHKSREYLCTLPKGGSTWTITGPKPSAAERKAAAAKAEKPAKAPKAAKQEAAEPEAAAAPSTVNAVPKPSKKSKK